PGVGPVLPQHAQPLAGVDAAALPPRARPPDRLDRRLRPLLRRPRRQPDGIGPPGVLARGRPDRGAHAVRPLLAARGPRAELRPDGAGERAAGTPGDRRARAAHRADPG